MPVAPATRVVTHVYSLHLRADAEPEGDGRTLVGLAVPYDVELDVSDWWDDYSEVFRKGAFARTIRNRANPVPLLFHHERRGLPVGKATELTEQDDGLHASFHLTEGITAADEVLAAVKDGTMTGLSIGFEPVAHRVIAGPARTPPSARELHERTEVVLREVSVCNFPAYEDAGVTGVRAAQRHPTMAAQGRHPTMAELGADRTGRAVRVVALRDRVAVADRIRVR